MKKILFFIILMTVFGFSAFPEPPHRMCGENDCDDVYRNIAVDAIMALLGSSEAALIKVPDRNSYYDSYNFYVGVQYSFCIKMINHPYNEEQCRSKYSAQDWHKDDSTERWQEGKDAADKVWPLFESAGVVVSTDLNPSSHQIKRVINIYIKAKKLEEMNADNPIRVEAEDNKKAHQFNDNPLLSLEENIKIAIASVKPRKEEWDRHKQNKNIIEAAERDKEYAIRTKIQAEHTRKLNKQRVDIQEEINAASKTPKGRLDASREIMCKATRDYYDETLDLRNPSGAMDREYKFKASRDAFFTLLEESGGNKHHRFEEPRVTFKRYCR